MHGTEWLRLFRALALVAGGCILLVQAAGAQAVNPYLVVDAYERAWLSGDVDAALDQLADDAVLTLQDARQRRLSGRREIGAVLRRAIPSAEPVVTAPRRLDGNTVTWSLRTDGRLITSPDVTVRAVVEHGRIQSLTYRPGRTGGDSPRAAPTTLVAATLAVGGIAALAVGLLLFAGVPRRPQSNSRLRGRLLQDLHRWRTRPLT
jgi:hypothetical protein